MQMKIKRTISAFLTAVILLISNSVLAAPASQDIPTAPEETTPPQVITSDVPEPPDDFVSTGNGSWYSDGIYHDSAEALGVDVSRAYLSENNNEYYGDLSEYVLENEYFIIDESLQGYLSNNISPEVFNKFMHQMVLGYKAMYDLIGQKPGDGTKVLMRDMTPECYNAGAHMHTHPDYIICWQTNDIISILRNLQKRNADDWWLEGAMHELGHVFENVVPWNWAGEGWASYFAWLAIMKNNAQLYCSLPVNPADDIYEGFFDDVEIIEHNVWDNWENRYVDKAYFDNPIKYYWYKNLLEHLTSSDSDFFINKQHYMVYLLNPIFEHLGWDEGWEILQKVFASYNDDLFIPKDYKGKVYQIKLADFVDRCSYFSGVNIKEFWLTATVTHFENTLIPPSTPYVILEPLYPKVGDEVTFTVYNCPADQNLLVKFWNGEIWTRKYMDFSKGENIDIPYGYEITNADIDYSFHMNIEGLVEPEIEEWSNETWIVVRSRNKIIDFEHNLQYENNIITLNTVKVTMPAFSFQKVYFKVEKYTPNIENATIFGTVQMDNNGSGTISFDTISLLTSNKEYIKISLYKDVMYQELLTQQLISPILFDF